MVLAQTMPMTTRLTHGCGRKETAPKRSPTKYASGPPKPPKRQPTDTDRVASATKNGRELNPEHNNPGRSEAAKELARGKGQDAGTGKTPVQECSESSVAPSTPKLSRSASSCRGSRTSVT